MIIDDLDAFRAALAPGEADSPLIVNPHTMLTLSIAVQSLKPVSRDGRHVLQPLGIVQHSKFPSRHGFNVAEFTAPLAKKKLLGLLAAEGSYQTSGVPREPLNDPRSSAFIGG
jgi:hypothetical protein